MSLASYQLCRYHDDDDDVHQNQCHSYSIRTVVTVLDLHYQTTNGMQILPVKSLSFPCSCHQNQYHDHHHDHHHHYNQQSPVEINRVV